MTPGGVPDVTCCLPEEIRSQVEPAGTFGSLCGCVSWALLQMLGLLLSPGEGVRADG